MSYNSTDTCFSSSPIENRNWLESEDVGSRPTRCMYNLSIKKKKKRLASIPDLSLLSLIYRQFLRQD